MAGGSPAAKKKMNATSSMTIAASPRTPVQRTTLQPLILSPPFRPESEGDVAVLARRRLDALVQAELEGAHQQPARLARLADVVDVAPLRRDVRIREPLQVVRDQLLASLVRVLGGRQLAPIDDVDGVLGPHRAD